MTRADLIKRMMNNDKQHTQRDLEQATGIILRYMARHLVQDKRIELRGFGSFYCVTHQACTIRHPRTGAPLRLPKRQVPHFRPSRLLLKKLPASTK